ncbi:MAG: hypothetical protein LUE26_09810 [Alistipes sp.]|nr:hypothetical protein [Alistipes sp.]
MKNLFGIFVLGGILSLGITACNDDDGYSLRDRYYNFGMVEAIDGKIENGFNIRLDNGTWLVINNSYAVRNIKDGDRIIAAYTILGELDPYRDDKRYLAILTDYSRILSKSPVLQSFIDQDAEVREDSIGYDPIRVDNAWFGGKYLNIEFSVPRKQGTNVVHMLNLVADDTEEGNDGTLNLYFRHNAFDDVPEPGSGGFVYTSSLVSFDLTELVPEGAGSLDIALHWTQFSSTEWDSTFDGEKTGTFRPYGKDNQTPSIESMKLELDYLTR